MQNPDDWLRPREIAEMLEVPLRRVQLSFSVEAKRALWWEPEGKVAWQREPLTDRDQYRARRWAVDRLTPADGVRPPLGNGRGAAGADGSHSGPAGA